MLTYKTGTFTVYPKKDHQSPFCPFAIFMALGFTFFGLLLNHYTSERRFYNEMTTFYDNQTENIKFLNKNY
jgi:hypothetical protein